MSCITQLLKIKGDKEFLPIHDDLVIEGGGNYKDYEYLITFTHWGTRCGYVAVKNDDEIHFKKEKGEDEHFYPDLDVHGGVTFYSKSHSAKDLLPVFCSDFWVGFDAGHCDDLGCTQKTLRYFGESKNISKYIDYIKKHNGIYDDCTNPVFNPGHRSYEYIENECKSIIDQLVSRQ